LKVHPNVDASLSLIFIICLFIYLLILQRATFIAPSHKNHDAFNTPQIKIFSTNMGLW
jgi:hypothetical protein